MASGLGPWVLGITEHRRTPGHARVHHLSGPLPGLVVAEVSVPDDAEVAADLELEVLVDGRLTAMGRVRAPWVGTCRRCLEPVSGTIDTELSEVFEADPAPDAETYPLAGDRVDLEPAVRDAVLLGLPLAPLCDEACAGPDPEGHPVGDASVDDEPDPRWSALGELRFD